MEHPESFLRITVIWKDEFLLQLRFSVSSRDFHGSTCVYENLEALKELAAMLEGFPNEEPSIIYKVGEKNKGGYCAIKFYQADPSGLIGLRVYMEGTYQFFEMEEQSSRLSLLILTEPNAVDFFRRQLIILTQQQEGEAMLEGRMRYY